MKNAWFVLTVLAVFGMTTTSFARGGGHGGGGHHGGGHHAGGHHAGHHVAHHTHTHHHTGHHAGYHHGGWHGHHDGWHSWHHGYWGGWGAYPGIWGAGNGLGWAANNYTYRNPFWSDNYAGVVNYGQPITTSSYTDDAPLVENNPFVPVQSDVNDGDDNNDSDDDSADGNTDDNDADDNTADDNDGDDNGTPNETQKQALAKLEAGRAAFRAGNYAEAQSLAEAAIKLWPEDVVAHEFRALTLFAQKKYRESAAATYAVLAGGPGWDEETLLSFYPDRKVYQEQLEALARYVRENPKAADAEFVLAYHLLTAGDRDLARAELERVAQLEPGDRLTAELIKALNVKPQAATN